MAAQSETFVDQPLRFSIPSMHARGRLVRLDAVLDAIIASHAYPPVIEKTLAEALVLTALLGATLKDSEGQLTLQAQTENGPISMLVCDYRDGALRGYVSFDLAALAMMPADPTLFALFGKGYLAITFDRQEAEVEGGGRYQGIVPLEGESLCEAVAQYFVQSEQIPTLIRAGVSHQRKGDCEGCIAGGFLIQHLPEGEEGRERLHVRLDHPEWEHVHALGSTLSADEMVDRELPLEEIVWRLFHEEQEVRIEKGTPLSKGCRCDPDHIRNVLASFPASERKDMADDSGDIVVNCEFCSRKFPISLVSLHN